MNWREHLNPRDRELIGMGCSRCGGALDTDYDYHRRRGRVVCDTCGLGHKEPLASKLEARWQAGLRSR